MSVLEERIKRKNRKLKIEKMLEPVTKAKNSVQDYFERKQKAIELKKQAKEEDDRKQAEIESRYQEYLKKDDPEKIGKYQRLDIMGPHIVKGYDQVVYTEEGPLIDRWYVDRRKCCSVYQREGFILDKEKNELNYAIVELKYHSSDYQSEEVISKDSFAPYDYTDRVNCEWGLRSKKAYVRDKNGKFTKINPFATYWECGFQFNKRMGEISCEDFCLDTEKITLNKEDMELL